MQRCLWVACLLLMLMAGCAPSSQEDFEREGESLVRKLTAHLSDIQTREQLVEAIPKLKKGFNELVDLMIEAQKGRLMPEHKFLGEGSSASLLLQRQLERVYGLEGGREMIEKAQREALLRLDGFMKKSKAQDGFQRSFSSPSK